MNRIYNRQGIAILNSMLFFSADLSDSTLSYTEMEAASSPNITPGEFSGKRSASQPVINLTVTVFISIDVFVMKGNVMRFSFTISIQD